LRANLLERGAGARDERVDLPKAPRDLRDADLRAFERGQDR
jgi:hypothetical protein